MSWRSAANRQGISHYLESGHPAKWVQCCHKLAFLNRKWWNLKKCFLYSLKTVNVLLVAISWQPLFVSISGEGVGGEGCVQTSDRAGELGGGCVQTGVWESLGVYVRSVDVSVFLFLCSSIICSKLFQQHFLFHFLINDCARLFMSGMCVIYDLFLSHFMFKISHLTAR